MRFAPNRSAPRRCPIAPSSPLAGAPPRRHPARGSTTRLTRGEQRLLRDGIFRHRGQVYEIDVVDERTSGYTRVRWCRRDDDGRLLPPDPASYRDQHEALAETRRRIDAWLKAADQPPAPRREVAPAVA